MLTRRSHHPQLPRQRDDAGYTLIELMVTIALLGTLSAFAVSGWQGWSRAAAHDGAATKVESILRLTQQQAVTEGSSMCVWFPEDDTWTLYRGACSDSDKVHLAGTYETGDKLVHIGQVRFRHDTSIERGVTFTPRGTATPGTITITRDGSPIVKTVRVEGLTGRVETD